MLFKSYPSCLRGSTVYEGLGYLFAFDRARWGWASEEKDQSDVLRQFSDAICR